MPLYLGAGDGAPVVLRWDAATLALDGERHALVHPDELTLHILWDRSVFEIFADGGRVVLTAWHTVTAADRASSSPRSAAPSRPRPRRGASPPAGASPDSERRRHSRLRPDHATNGDVPSAVTPAAILDQIRSQYVARLARAVADAPESVVEPILRDEDGDTATEGEFGLGMRMDLVVVRDGQPADPITVDSPSVVAFEPFEIAVGDVPVAFEPFAWDAVRVTLEGLAETASLSPVSEWFHRWFDETEEHPRDDRTGLLGVVHFLSDATRDGEQCVLTADLGSAPVDALHDLLDVLANLAPSRVTVDASGCETVYH
jgi:hypothetical protein